MKLDIIIPSYNEEKNVTLIYKKISDAFKNINYEIIYVNDGSTDNTYKELKKLYEDDQKHVKVVNFSRNFGKEAAIFAGLEKSDGKYTAIIDADLEQNPKYLKEMLAFLEDNQEYDEVCMINKERKNHRGLHKFLARSFYKVINSLSDVKFEPDASDFRMFRKNVRDAILKLNEKNRFSKGIFSWVGFNIKYLPYDVEKRIHGTSNYGIKKSFKYAMDGIIGYSIKPLKIITSTGITFSFVGFMYLLYVLIKTIVIGVDTPGFATIVCLILFIGGIQLISIGMLGEYISKTFIETKNRPIYIEKNSLGFDDDIL